MDTVGAIRKFNAIGARVKFRAPARRDRGRGRGQDFVIDVLRDSQGEYFDVQADGRKVQVHVVDAQARDRHLLLHVQHRATGPQRFLCGHDERHWFAAAVSTGASSVVRAKDSLKPPEVRLAEQRAGVRRRRRNRRRNAAFVRQGEWFFIPTPDLRADPKLVLFNEPLRRGWGKPHMAERLYRTGGELVYVCSEYSQGVTERQYKRLLDRQPRLKKLPWRAMRRNMGVFVTGRIRHPDHKTVVLRGWHRVAGNLEQRSLSVAFLD